jgi:hypothetical protein
MLSGPSRFSTALFGLVLVLVLFGLGFRIAPLLDDGGRRMAMWPTEDGYFMLTMGRNVGLGRGLSVAGGEMPTNGTQPLTTFVWAAGYALVGPAREAGVFFALVLQVIASAIAAFALFALGKRVFRGREDATGRAALAAGVWFASPVAMPHTMNCLETGFYGMMVVFVSLALLAGEGTRALWSWKRTTLFGGLLGVAFWVRNDSAFLIAASCVAYLWPAIANPEERKARFGRVFAFGATSVAVASPWLVYNYLGFGSVMPVSGRAEALTGHLNIAGVPVVIAEYLMGFLPIPHAISDHAAVQAGAALLVVGVAAVLFMKRSSMRPTERTLLLVGAVYVGLMAFFYGVYFGAPWFLARYFLPTSPLLALVFASTVFVGVQWLSERAPRAGRVGRVGLSVAMLGVIVFLSVRQYRQGHTHPHFHVVQWVQDNVPEETWVGAVQTGTLGFFHDRTINLDGKVNLAAFEALVAGREGEYVVEDTEIEYLVDWIGMRDWMDKPAIAQNFEILVQDEAENLGVLRRKPAPSE